MKGHIIVVAPTFSNRNMHLVAYHKICQSKVNMTLLTGPHAKQVNLNLGDVSTKFCQNLSTKIMGPGALKSPKSWGPDFFLYKHVPFVAYH